jgi:carboxyl-terminal processing protease
MDLRGNAGGLLESAVETCDLFIPEGRIVSIRGRGGAVRRTREATPAMLVPHHMPIAVLVNRYSASASEIVAACLQDHDRAVIVGERTWGKGTVQNVIELEGGRSALKLTTASYWRPSGRNIHRGEGEGEEAPWGVRPNDGYLVRFDDKEMENVLLDRRRRDLYDDAPEDRPGSEGDVGSSEHAAPVPDRQRERAWEYLRSRLGSHAVNHDQPLSPR